MSTPQTTGNVVRVLRWLTGQMVRDGYGYAHVTADLARMLAEPGSPRGGCRSCGAALPLPARTGRPRVLCLACGPRRKTPENGTVESQTDDVGGSDGCSC